MLEDDMCDKVGEARDARPWSSLALSGLLWLNYSLECPLEGFALDTWRKRRNSAARNAKPRALMEIKGQDFDGRIGQANRQGKPLFASGRIHQDSADTTGNRTPAQGLQQTTRT